MLKASHKKWIIIGLLSTVFFQYGFLMSVIFIQFIAWVDDDILHQYCSYEECPLKYDVVEIIAWVLIPLGSFLMGYLSYYLLKKSWDKFVDKEIKNEPVNS